MRRLKLGAAGPEVSAVGLGCMGMTDLYGPADRAEGLATIAAALDAGVDLLDTGDFYGMGDNEMLIAEALAGRRRDQVRLSVKFGALRGPNGAWLGVDGRPASVKTFCAYSLKRLKTDYIDVYRLSRLDPRVPIEDTIGAIAELIQAGHVRHIGLSEVGAETIARAAAVHPIVDLQIEYSLISRGVEAEILPQCRRHGIAITAYGVLGRGLISGGWSAGRAPAPNDFRAHSPRFSKDALSANLALADGLRTVAAAFGLSPAQAAIAWVASRGSDIIPLVGARTRAQLKDCLEGVDRQVGAEALAAIDAAAPADAVVGTRYPQPQMAMLDSERRSK